MKKVYIYIDESGTPALQTEKAGGLPYMVYCAFIIEEQSITQAKEILSQAILQNHIQQGYIKSVNLHDNADGYNKRINILNLLKPLEHYVIALIIDKSKIDETSGLQYKQSYIKYFQRMLSKQFLQRYDEFHVVFDRLGRKDFRDSLVKYMHDNGIYGRTLFYDNSYKLADDITEEPLLQFADFYAGTINKYFCQKYEPNQAKYLHESFLKEKVTYEWFPDESITLFAAENLFSERFDRELYELSVQTAKQYIDSHENGDVEGVELIKYILQESSLNPFRVISSKEIKHNLQKRGIEIGDPISKISSLRDNEVVIISPQGKKGYKFPTSEKELADFYDRLRDNVIPQLRRCQTINNVLQEKSIGKYGILKHEEYKLLNKLCEVIGIERHINP